MTLEPLGNFEALRHLGELADLQPVVTVDSREQTPLPFTRLRTLTLGLDAGDYSFCGGERTFAIERKSIPDLVACCTRDRERFERELVKLRGYHFKRLLIIGTPGEVEAHNYRSRVSSKAVLHTLAAFECRYDLPVVWTPTPEAGAAQVESWAWWFAREQVRAVNLLFSGTTCAAELLPRTASAPESNGFEIGSDPD